MEERISFELSLFDGDRKSVLINDLEFCVDRIMTFPKIRPQQLKKAVSLSEEYCQIAGFRRKMLEKANSCPVLIYRLFKRDVFIFEEIEPFLRNKNTFELCYYFRKEINDFETFINGKKIPDDFDGSFFNNENDIDQMIEYGFICSTIEYTLKYDVIEDLNHYHFLNQEAKWSPFEWSLKPYYLDLLSFSGYFGSIKCFKHLMMNGFFINDKVMAMVVGSGCFDLFHLCMGKQIVTSEVICMASIFCNISLLDFLFENGYHIDENDISVEIEYSVVLPFILLLLMVI